MFFIDKFYFTCRDTTHETKLPNPKTVTITAIKFCIENKKGNGIVGDAITKPKLICSKPITDAISKPVIIAIDVIIKPVKKKMFLIFLRESPKLYMVCISLVLSKIKIIIVPARLKQAIIITKVKIR